MFRFMWPRIIKVREERTNRWHRYRCLFTISLISTCFGHHYAHRQENRLYKTACGVSLDMLAAIVWSRDTSWAHCSAVLHSFIQSVLLTMGLMMPETCWD